MSRVQGWERCTLRAARKTFASTCRFGKNASMKFSLGIVLVISLVLASCAKHPVTQVTVKVADTYFGHIRPTPCIQVAQEPVVIDASGNRHTGASCPLGGVRTVVVKPSKSLDIAPENVHVRRSGDGSSCHEYCRDSVRGFRTNERTAERQL